MPSGIWSPLMVQNLYLWWKKSDCDRSPMSKVEWPLGTSKINGAMLLALSRHVLPQKWYLPFLGRLRHIRQALLDKPLHRDPQYKSFLAFGFLWQYYHDRLVTKTSGKQVIHTSHSIFNCWAQVRPHVVYFFVPLEYLGRTPHTCSDPASGISAREHAITGKNKRTTHDVCKVPVTELAPAFSLAAHLRPHVG